MADQKRIFLKPYLSYNEGHDGNGYVCVLNPDGFKKDRKASSFQLPDPLRTPRSLSADEFEEIEYSAGSPDKTYYLDSEPQSAEDVIPFARHVSSETMHEFEILPALIWLREQLFSPYFLKKLELCQKYGERYSEEKLQATPRGGDNDVKEGQFSLGLSVMPHSGPSSICMGKIGRAQDPEIDAWLKYVFQIGNAILHNCFPDQHAEGRRKQWLKGSFVPRFSGGCNLLTSAWISVSDYASMAEKPPENPFTNRRDDPSQFSVYLNLSNVPEHYHGGRISLPSQRISFSLRPLKALMFPARHYQFISGIGPYAEQRDSQIPLPIDSPLRLPRDPRVPDLPPDAPKLRITVPLYPTLPLVEAKFATFSKEAWSDIMHNMMDPIEHRLFMMRQYIENEIMILSRTQGYQPDKIEGSGPTRLAFATETFKKARVGRRNVHDDPFIDEAPTEAYIMQLKLRGFPEELLGIFKIPKGDGLNLSQEQQRSLLKLKASDRHKRASKIFNKDGHAYQAYAYIEKEKDEIAKFESEKNEEYENIGRRLTRNCDPEYYTRLFAWTDPEGYVHYPDVNLAAEALKNHGVPNEKIEKLEKRSTFFLCGEGLPDRKKEGKNRSHIQWTHTDLEHVFDPEAETIPDNPSWNSHLGTDVDGDTTME